MHARFGPQLTELRHRSHRAIPAVAQSISVTKILPSPLAARCRPHDRVDDIVGMTGGTATSIWTFGRKVTAYSVPRSSSVCSISEPLDLGYGHASDADLRQCVPHFVELEGLDDGDDEFMG